MGNKFGSRLLGELCHEITVGFVGPMTNEYIDNGIPFLRSKNIDEYDVKWDDMKYISLEFHKKLSKSALKPGDVAIVRTGKPGTTCVIPNNLEEANCSDIIIVRVNNELLCPHYLSYFMNAMAHGQVNAHVVGAVQQHFNVGSAKKLEIPLPIRAIQANIVHVLKTLDDKVKLNRQINQTLEQMAQALFKSWFVDYDPVVDNALDAGFFEQDLEFSDELLRQAKARKMAREEGTFKELPDVIRQLFPAAFTYCAEPSSGLGGWVPVGWGNVAIYSLADFVNGAAYKAFEPNMEQRGLPIIKITELKSGVTPQTAFSDRDMPEKYRLNTGNILFSWSGNPDTSIDTFIWTHGEAWLNQHIFKITPPNGPGERSFVLMALKYLKPIFAEIARNKQTTGLGHVTIADLKRLQIVKPEPRILAAWDSLVTPYVNQAFTLTQQAHTLAKLRDTLLPKLISGDLRLDEIEEQFAEGDLVKPC